MLHPSNSRQLLILAYIIFYSDLGACPFSKLLKTQITSGIVPFDISINCLEKEYADIMTGKMPRSSWTPNFIHTDCVGKSLRYLAVIPVRGSYANISMDCRGHCLPLDPATSEATATYECSKTGQAVSLTKTPSIDCLLPYVSKKKQFHCAAYASLPQVFTRLTSLDGVWYLTIPTQFIIRESPAVIKYSMDLKIGTAPFGLRSSSGSIYNFDVFLQIMPYALNDRCRIHPKTGMASSTWFSVECSDLSKYSQAGGFYYSLFYESGSIKTNVITKKPLTQELKVAFQVPTLSQSTPIEVSVYVFNNVTTSACFETKAVYTITKMEPFDKVKSLDAEINSLPYGDNRVALRVTSSLVKAIHEFSKNTTDMTNSLLPSELKSRRDKNAERREKMLKSMLGIKPENQTQDSELVKLINNLTNVDDELTRVARKSASDLYEKSAVKLSQRSSPFLNVQNFVKDLLTGVGSLLNSVSDRGGLLAGKVGNDTTNSFVEIASTLVKSTTRIGHGVFKAGYFAPGQEYVKLPGMQFGLKVKNSSAICERPMNKSLFSQSRSINVTFSCSYDSVPNVSRRLAISSLYMLRDPFAISDLSAKMNFPVLSVNIFTENLNKVDMKSIVLEFSEPKTYFNIEWKSQTLKFAFQLNGSHLIPTYDSNFSVPSFEVTTPATSIRSLFVNIVKGPFQLDIVVQYKQKPTYKQLVTNSFHRHTESRVIVGNKGQNYSVFIPSRTGGKDTYHILTVPLENYTISDVLPFISAGTNGTILVHMQIGISSKSCVLWDSQRRLWSTDGCRSMLESSRNVDVVMCECLHLSMLSANLFVLPNLVNPIDDSYLLLQFFDNPIVFALLVYVWTLYVSLLYWCRRIDRKNKSLAIITVLGEDLAGHIYLVGLRTRWLPHAGTTAKVFLILFGSQANSTVYYLRDTYKPCFKTGDESWFLLTTEQSIGELQRVSIWHDNSGPSPDWRLDHVVVQDFESKQIWVHLCPDWISVKRGLKSCHVLLSTLTLKQLQSKRLYQFRTQIVDGFRNSHEWMSVVLKTPTNSFTHTQRLTCAFNLLLAIMLTSIMFYGIPTDNPRDQIHTGPIDISIKSLVISIETSLVIIPVGIFLSKLFSNISPKSTHLQFKKKKDGVNVNKENQYGLRTSSSASNHPMVKMENKRTIGKEDVDKKQTTPSELIHNDKDDQAAGIHAESEYKRQAKSYRESTSQQTYSESNGNSTKRNVDRFTCCVPNFGSLPWWFIYISWMINITFCLLSTYLIVLYGFKYGKQESVNWLCSFFFSFSQSAVLEQPVRIVLKAVMIVVWLSNRIKPEQFSLNIRKMDDDELLEMIQEQCHFEEEFTCAIPTPSLSV